MSMLAHTYAYTNTHAHEFLKFDSSADESSVLGRGLQAGIGGERT